MDTSSKQDNFKLRFELEHIDCLYRYRCLDAEGRNLQALDECRLYFSVPKNFNDPYDTLLFADSNQIVLNILQRLGKLVPSIDDAEGVVDDIYKYVTGLKLLIRKNVKLICFSEVYDSMLMWSHYADSHKGFALMYDLDSFANAKCFTSTGQEYEGDVLFGAVEYVERQLDLTQTSEDVAFSCLLSERYPELASDFKIDVGQLLAAIRQKREEWHYEKEWRLLAIMDNLDEPSPAQYLEVKPSGVILGSHCFNEAAEKIIAAAQRQDIHVYRMFLDEFDPTFPLRIGEGIGARIV